MDERRVEVLLERIAVALERLCIAIEREDVNRSESSPGFPLQNDLKMPSDSAPSSRASEGVPSRLESFLSHRGITIKSVPEKDPSDEIIDSLSVFVGERYDALSSILSKIKRAMQTGRMITESLKDRSQEDISSTCQFCTRLHEIAFLEQYKYFRSPTYLIKAKTTTLPKAQRFFGGQWLERFVLVKSEEIQRQVSSEYGVDLPFDYLINPQVVLPNGDDFELDLLIALGNEIYWIEAKSGDYQQHVAKYSKFSRLLGLDYAHSLMVLTDVPEERCQALSSLFSMTVCNLKTFGNTLQEVFRSDLQRKVCEAAPVA